MKYKIEEHPNNNRLTVHLNKKITDEMIVTVHAPRFMDLEEELQENEELKYLTGALFQIMGIEALSFCPYNISFTKGLCFDWCDLEPEIISCVHSMVAPNEDIIELPRITMSDDERKRIAAQIEKMDCGAFDMPGMGEEF